MPCYLFSPFLYLSDCPRLTIMAFMGKKTHFMPSPTTINNDILSLGPYLTDVYIRVYTVYMLQSEFGFQINNFSYEAFFVI